MPRPTPLHSSNFAGLTADHVAVNAKSYVALLGSIAVALLTVYGPESTVGQVLTVVSVIATAFSTWAVPNASRTDA